MTYSNSLTDYQTSLVLDTSVLINLHASKYGSLVLSCIPNQILVPEIVSLELEHVTSKNNGEYQFIRDLIVSGKVKSATLSDDEYELFENLVAGRASLDDGEAATIAIASCRNCQPVIDERKGRGVAIDYIRKQSPAWSLDLILHPHVSDKLGGEIVVNALYLALHDGRMRIEKSHCTHVIELLGVEKAMKCKCLPGYKSLLEKWGSRVA